MHILRDAFHTTRRYGLLTVLVVGGSACLDPSGPARDNSLSSSPVLAAGTREVTIDFSTFGHGENLDPDFYRRDGIAFPDQFCGSAGCGGLFIGFVQGDAALTGDPRRGPVTATFNRPISELSLVVAPAFQGTATYTLNVFSASGALVGTSSVTVTQDQGDPANTGFGYFEIGVSNPDKRVKSFTLNSVVVRASSPFPHVGFIPYGVSSITYTY